MKLILSISFLFSVNSVCSAVPSDVVLIGHFSNIQATDDDDPHIVAGYSVHLYRQDNEFFGNVAVATGSLEPAQGRLYGIVFDPLTKKLRFKAKFVAGWAYDKRSGPEGRESRQLMTFSGRLTPKALTGRVVLNDGYDQKEVNEKSFVSMKRLKDAYKPASRETWNGFKHLDAGWE
jgi:hypothetical protein